MLQTYFNPLTGTRVNSFLPFGSIIIISLLWFCFGYIVFKRAGARTKIGLFSLKRSKRRVHFSREPFSHARISEGKERLRN